jgi:hypothetical protein
MQLFVHRNEPNRPHISSDTINFKERETRQTEMRLNLPGAPRLHYLDISLRLVASAFPRWPVWRPVAACRCAGEGVFTYCGSDPQALFSEISAFFAKSFLIVQNQ